MGERTLWLLRHAKAVDFVPGGQDFDRPLTARGERQAADVGAWLADRPRRPGLALCSPSVRTQQTLARLGLDLPVRLAPGVWEGGSDDIAAEIATVGDEVDELLVVGHGPGLPSLAALLADGPDDAPDPQAGDAAAELHRHFPTAAVAQLAVDGAWTDFGPGRLPVCRLVAFRSGR